MQEAHTPNRSRRSATNVTSPFLNAVWLALLAVAVVVPAQAQEVTVSIDDPSPNHVHPVGQAFAVDVAVTDPGIPDATIFVQWVNPKGEPLAAPVVVTPGQVTRFVSPSGEAGHYDLRFSSDHADVRFPPQDPGFHIDFGFSILPVRSVSSRVLDNESFFGMTHADRTDPYLRGWIKTMTLDTASPANFAQRILDYQQIDRVQELPLVNGAEWDTDNTRAITDAELDALGNRFGTYLDALLQAQAHVPAWQLGREENRNDRFTHGHFFANLEKKAARIRLELDSRGLQDVLTAFSMRGFDYDEFTAFAASAAAEHFDVLGFHPYKWNDFPSPDDEDEWMRSHIETVHRIMQDHGGPTRLWMTEFGIPHHGNNNPDGFYGYPSSGAVVYGGSREHAARYIVKSHVIAMATGLVEKIFYYNYYDRGGSEVYAEDHFGLRMNADLTTSGDARVNGHTKPAYVAYATLVDQLDGMTISRLHEPQDDVWVYEFTPRYPGVTDTVIAVWSLDDGDATIELDALRSGLAAAQIDAVTTMYGADASLDGDAIVIGARPVYLRVSGDGSPVADEPSLSLSAEPQTIGFEETTTLRWAGEYVDTCTASGAWTGERGTSGEEVVGPLDSESTFTLACAGPNGFVNASVTVEVAPPPLPTVVLSANPTEIAEGGTTRLSWESTSADGCLATGDWSGTLPANGRQDVGPLFDDAEFTLSCTGTGGTVHRTVTVSVLAAPADSDGDGLDDAWEVGFFGNLDSDGDADPDSDGADNASEFLLNTDPTNSDTDGDGADDGSELRFGSDPLSAVDNWHDRRPDQPVILQPDGPLPVRKVTMDVANGYSDPDQDALHVAEWQIAADDSFVLLAFSREVNRKTRLRLPSGVLETGNTYHVRTRHWDQAGLPSLWSEPVRVGTESRDALDEDGDGMADAYQVYEYTDLDANGVEDNAETGMCAMYDAESRQVIGIRTDSGTLTCVTAIASGEIPSELKSDTALPYGLFGFKVDDLPVDGSEPAQITVTLYVPETLEAGTELYLYDEAGDTFEAFTGNADFRGDRIEVTYVDGGIGDKDGLANGVIIDPVGPSRSPTSSTPSDPIPGEPVTSSPTDSSSGEGGGGAPGPAVILLMLGWFARRRAAAAALSYVRCASRSGSVY